MTEPTKTVSTKKPRRKMKSKEEKDAALLKREADASALPPPTKEQIKLALRRAVRWKYDLQKDRIRLGNRGGVDRTEEDAPRDSTPGKTPAIDLHPLHVLRFEAMSKHTKGLEDMASKQVAEILAEIPFYQVLKDVTGIGPNLAGVILSEVDITVAKTPSALWRYAGLDVLPAWRSKETQEVVKPNDKIVSPDGDPVEFITPKGKKLSRLEVFKSGRTPRPTKGEKITYNKFLKAKMVGVLGDIIVKQVDSPYRKIYDDYKLRLQSKEWGVSDGHRHRASIRYAVKMLLLDVWKMWREFEGLTVRESYQDAKLKNHDVKTVEK